MQKINYHLVTLSFCSKGVQSRRDRLLARKNLKLQLNKSRMEQHEWNQPLCKAQNNTKEIVVILSVRDTY